MENDLVTVGNDEEDFMTTELDRRLSWISSVKETTE